MAKNSEISEDTVVGLSLKTIGLIVSGAVIVSLGYFDLKADVQEAKELPEPAIGRTEYDLKDQLIRETIMNTKSDVDEIKIQLDKIERRLFEMK